MSKIFKTICALFLLITSQSAATAGDGTPLINQKLTPEVREILREMLNYQKEIDRKDRSFANDLNLYAPCESFRVSKWQDCFGIYIFPSGARYIGEFEDISFDLEPDPESDNNDESYTLPYGDDIDSFVSLKSNGYIRRRVMASGRGIYTFPDGGKYVGSFKKNDFNGQGVFTSKDGAKIWGEWKNSKLHGKGIYYRTDGSIEEHGIYKNHKLMKTQYIEQIPHISWYESLDRGIRLYAMDFSVPAISKKYVENAETNLASTAKVRNDAERKKYAGASINQGKTGPVGFGAIKLGMHILDIYALPKSEAIRIPENGWMTTEIPHNAHCLNKSAQDQLTCASPLSTEISFSDWKSRPEKFPERIDFKVNISSPFVERELRGFLGAKNGILTSIRLDLSSFSRYEQEIIMLRDNVLKLLNEKFGYTKPVVEKREAICGQTRFAQITTSHDWKDNNKLLGTVISELKTEELVNCYNWMQPYREVKVVLTIGLPNKNAAPSIKNVF